jgi:hypothetical protein
MFYCKRYSFLSLFVLSLSSELLLIITSTLLNESELNALSLRPLTSIYKQQQTRAIFGGREESRI